jgi:WD40 repeat protein/mono/diheme cytochrome c family protein
MKASCIICFLALTLPLAAQDAAGAAQVFARNCTGCHSASSKVAGLNLETSEGLLQGGKKGAVIVPGKSEQSRLYLMMSGQAQPAMPVGGKVSPADLQAVKQWIDGGAKGSYSVAQSTAIPAIKPAVPVKPQIFSLAYSPDGKMIALGGYKEVTLLDAATRKPIAVLKDHAEVVRAVAFSKDGKRLAAAGGVAGRRGEVKIWDVAARTVASKVEGHDDTIYSVAFAPDGATVATCSYDKFVKLWDAATGKEVRTFKDHIDAVYALAFTPDGKRLLSGAADRTIKIWDTASGERLYTLGEPTDGINAIAIHPAGNMVAAAGLDKSIRIWQLEEKSGRLLQSQIAHEDAVLALAWSPDGSTLLSASADKTLKIFKVPELTEIKTIAHQPDWIYSLQFAPDGKTFAAGRYDGSLSIYDMNGFRDIAEVRTASR